MTRSTLLATLVTLAIILIAPLEAAAQRPIGNRPGPVPSPTVSPYLNLLRRGTPPAVNYYGLVRPELQLMNNLQYLQQQLDANRTLFTEQTGADTGIPITGKSVSFMNTSGYFMNLSPTGVSAYGTFGAGASVGSRPAAGPRPLPPRR